MLMLFHFGPNSGGEPSPIVIIKFIDEITKVSTSDLSAFVDTGADGTIVPLPLLQQAGFRPNRQRRQFYTAQTGRPPEVVIGYSVSLHMGSFQVKDVDIYASRTVNEIILGRDLLNRMVFTYDGPQRLLEIVDFD